MGVSIDKIFEYLSRKNSDELNELVAVYYNKDNTDSFVVGKIVGCDNHHLALALLSPNGYDDGLFVCVSSAIYRIEIKTKYITGFESINFKPNYYFTNSPWDEVLKLAEKERLVVELRYLLGNKRISGIPLEHSSNKITLQRILSDGSVGRVSNVCKSKVAILSCNPIANGEMKKYEGAM